LNRQLRGVALWPSILEESGVFDCHQHILRRRRAFGRMEMGTMSMIVARFLGQQIIQT